MKTSRFRNWNQQFQVEPTDWGLTNQVFLLSDPVGKYVLRAADTQNPFADYQQEIKINQLIQSYHLTAPWLDFWVEQTTFFNVTKYLVHDQQWRTVPLTDTILKRIAHLVQSLHEIPVTSQTGIKKLDLITNLQLHTVKIAADLPAIITLNLKQVKTFLQQWTINVWVLSHNDLVKENFLLTNQSDYLIDYEYASLNSHYYDIACFIAETELWEQPIQLRTWLNCFHITEANQIQIIKYLTLYRLLIGYLWSYYQRLNATQRQTVYQKLADYKQQKISEFYNSGIAVLEKIG